MRNLELSSLAYVVFPVLVGLLVLTFFVHLQPAEIAATAVALLFVMPFFVGKVMLDIHRWSERRAGRKSKYIVIPKRFWLSLLLVVPAVLYLSQVVAFTTADLLVGFDPAGPIEGLRLIVLDAAVKGALFDLMESYRLDIAQFEPVQNKLTFQTLVFLSRLFWAAWFAAVLFNVKELIEETRFWKETFGFKDHFTGRRIKFSKQERAAIKQQNRDDPPTT